MERRNLLVAKQKVFNDLRKKFEKSIKLVASIKSGLVNVAKNIGVEGVIDADVFGELGENIIGNI